MVDEPSFYPQGSRSPSRDAFANAGAVRVETGAPNHPDTDNPDQPFVHSHVYPEPPPTVSTSQVAHVQGWRTGVSFYHILFAIEAPTMRLQALTR